MSTCLELVLEPGSYTIGMSTSSEQQEQMGTQPVAEHEWLKKMVGTWNTEAVMMMPDGGQATAKGRETVTLLGGLWAFAEGKSAMPDGSPMEYRAGLGYDVSFKEYRGFWLATMSSHLWKQTGTLSEDGQTMTMDCIGPDMMVDGKTANYREIIAFQDADHRTLTSMGQDEDGNWQEFMKMTLTRA